MRTAVCTICCNNYLHYARTLMQSLQATHPDWDRYVLIVDKPTDAVEISRDEFKPVYLEELSLPSFKKFMFRYTVLEVNTAVKPWMLAHLFRGRGYDRVMYIDPDIRVYSRMEELEGAFDVGNNIVLTPHLTNLLDDDKSPTELDIMRAGVWNLGFLGLQRDREVERLLDWWQKKLEYNCIVDFERGLFVDQRWIDLVPGLFRSVYSLRHEGYNVAYWNLNHRRVSRQGHEYLVNGQSLRFFHFSGLNPQNPEPFSKHQNRFVVSSLPHAAQELIAAYCQTVKQNGLEHFCKLPYTFSKFCDGLPIHDLMRVQYRSNAELQEAAGDDPFAEGGEAYNRPWKNGATVPLFSRIMQAVWESRPDLKQHFPDPAGANRADFAYWFVKKIHEEARIHACYVEPVRATLDIAPPVPTPHRVKRAVKAALGSPRLRALGRRLPSGMKARIKAIIGPAAVPPPPPAPAAPPVVKARKRSTDLDGFFDRDPSEQEQGFAWMGPRSTVRTAGIQGKSLKIHGQYMADLHAQAGHPATRLTVFADSVPVGSVELAESGPFCKSLELKGISAQPRELTIESSHYVVPRQIGLNGDERQLSVQIGRVELDDTVLIDFSHSRPYLPHVKFRPLTIGMNIVGYIRSELGVGQSARLCAAAAETAGIANSLYDFRVNCSSRAEDRSLDARISDQNPHRVNIFHINADQVPTAYQHLGPQFFEDRYNIGYWHWELPELPDHWLSGFNCLQEIWAPTQFVLNAVADKSPLPVVRIPHAIGFGVSENASRARFGLPENEFLFLMMYDMHSFQARKNPQAVVDAFVRAFPNPQGVKLVIKTMNSSTYASEFEELKTRLRETPGTVLIDRTLSRQEVYDLESVCDAFVSLHRSEGFGLGLAESMFLGKPVIGTNWSGNIDFMNAKNSCPVDYSLIELDRDYGPYQRGQHWADPSVDHAAWYMQKLFNDDSFRQRIAAAGQATIHNEFSYEAVGNLYRRRLLTIERLLD